MTDTAPALVHENDAASPTDSVSADDAATSADAFHRWFNRRWPRREAVPDRS